MDNTISGKIAKAVFEAMIEDSSNVDDIIEAKGLKQITDIEEIAKLVNEVIANNPEQVEQFREGKEQVLSYLVGQAMKLLRGKANPTQVNQILREKLK
jgi:aspartyl-tRNA(Asn)/glutamyl-tRNA(Gln) amidotransferase subunit B